MHESSVEHFNFFIGSLLCHRARIKRRAKLLVRQNPRNPDFVRGPHPADWKLVLEKPFWMTHFLGVTEYSRPSFDFVDVKFEFLVLVCLANLDDTTLFQIPFLDDETRFFPEFSLARLLGTFIDFKLSPISTPVPVTTATVLLRQEYFAILNEEANSDLNDFHRTPPLSRALSCLLDITAPPIEQGKATQRD